MSGAIAMSGRAAMLTGSGLVKVAVPSSILPIVASFSPEIMTVPLPENRSGKIAITAFEKILPLANEANVVVLGPGLGRSAGLDSLVFRLNREIKTPMLLDADALNAIASYGLERAAEAFTELVSFGVLRILTPHPGEFARFNQNLSTPRKTPQRVSAAENFIRNIQNRVAEKQYPLSEKSNATLKELNRTSDKSNAASKKLNTMSEKLILVLKGAETVVTDGTQTFVNTSGNPGMATGGSGDVLSGMIASLLGQHFSPLAAAELGAFLHGLAGDLAYQISQIPQESITAATLLEHIPCAIKEMG